MDTAEVVNSIAEEYGPYGIFLLLLTYSVQSFIEWRGKVNRAPSITLVDLESRLQAYRVLLGADFNEIRTDVQELNRSTEALCREVKSQQLMLNDADAVAMSIKDAQEKNKYELATIRSKLERLGYIEAKLERALEKANSVRG